MTTKSVSDRMSNVRQLLNRHSITHIECVAPFACFRQQMGTHSTKQITRALYGIHQMPIDPCELWAHQFARLFIPDRPHTIINIGDNDMPSEFRVFDTINEQEVSDDNIRVRDLRRHDRNNSDRRQVISRGEGPRETNIGYVLEDESIEAQPGYAIERRSKPGRYSVMASASNEHEGTPENLPAPPTETE